MRSIPPTSRRLLLAGAAGLTGAALATTVVTAERAAAADTGAGWLNVTDQAYGALGDDTADDAPAVQKAIDAAGQGGTVYFPPGRYRLAAPLRLSLGVTLRGDWNPRLPARTDMLDTCLRPSIGNFTGDALIVVDPGPARGGGPRLLGLALDGRDQRNTAGTAIDGIRIGTGAEDIGLDRVTVWRFTGHGVNARSATALRLGQVHTVANGGHGFTGSPVDAGLLQCSARDNGGHGYDILDPDGVTMVDCRAEGNARHGCAITGVNHSMVLIGCTTDGNGQDGFHLATSAGGRFLQLLGCLARRDGATGPAHSGFAVTGDSAEGVVLTACSTVTGRADDGAGRLCPAYGLTTSALASESFVTVVGGEYLGTTAPFRDGGAVVVRHSGVRAGTHTDQGVTWDESDVHMVSGAAGTTRDLQFRSRGDSSRWTLRTTAAPESGGDEGSDFVLVRHADDGTTLGTPFGVDRATGRLSLADDRASVEPDGTLAGKGLRVAEGPDARMGTLTLDGARPVRVATTAVTATSRVFLTVQSPAGRPSGVAYVAARVPGASFSVQGLPGDRSLVAWLMVDPA